MENPLMQLTLHPHHRNGKCAGLETGFDLAQKSKGIWKISKCKGPCEMLAVREISWEVLELVSAFTL